MREMSSRSSTSLACALTLREIAMSPRSNVAESRAVWRKTSDPPRMALSGVRSSCVRTARKWSLGRLAAPACASNVARSLFDLAACCEMSRAIFEAPTTFPVASRIGDTVSEIATWPPSRRNRIVSK